MTDYNTLSTMIRNLKKEINTGFKTGNTNQRTNQRLLRSLRDRAWGMTEAVFYEREARRANRRENEYAEQVALDS